MKAILLVLALTAACGAWFACYAHTPTPSCSQDPNQSECFPPLTDSHRLDAGQGDAR